MPASSLPARAQIASRPIDLLQIAGWTGVALAWVIAGLFWREPWKADEGYSIGIVLSMVRDAALLVPTLAGEPFMEKAPLVYWLAAATSWLFEGPLALHEAARIANVLIILGAAAALADAARIALGRRRARNAVLWLAASPFWLMFSRYLIADIGLVLASALMVNGLVRLERQAPWAGLWLGLGAGAGLLTKGLLLPGIGGLAVLGLLALRPELRTRRVFGALGGSLVCFLPIALSWPVTLWWHEPALFHDWFWTNNIGRFTGTAQLGATNERLRLLPTAGLALLPLWPVAALAVAARLRGKGLSGLTGLTGTTLFALGWLPVLLVSASARSLYLLPMVAPLALLAAAWRPAGGPRRRQATVTLITGLAAAALIGLVAARLLHLGGMPQQAIDDLAGLSAGQSLLAAAALAGMLLLAGAGRLRSPLAAWVCGLTVTWAATLALYLPQADLRTGFREVFTELAARVPPGAHCVASRGLGESERGMLHYYGELLTRRVEHDPVTAATCPVLIEQVRLADAGNPAAAAPDCPGMHRHWQGARLDDRQLLFRICVATP